MSKNQPLPYVVVTDYTFPTLAREEAAAASGKARFAAFQCASETEVIDAVAGATVVAVQFAPLSAKAIAGLAPGARIIRYGVGYDNIDIASALRNNHPVAYVPDYCTDEVADHTATLILARLRKVADLDRSVRAGEWSAVARARPMPAFSQTCIGFLGLGRIGRAVLERLKPFGFRFLIRDPALSDQDAAQLGAEHASNLETLLAQADVLTLHLPSSAETRHIISSSALAQMKNSAILINTARGDLIDEAALAVALQAGTIAAAALDVFQAEPLAADHPFRGLENLTLTPHAAWYSDSAIDKLQSCVADEIARGLAGREPRCPVPASG